MRSPDAPVLPVRRRVPLSRRESMAIPSTAADEDTFRCLISTDNHLGYQEKDPVRGNDSFAAFEEVLYVYMATIDFCDSSPFILA